MATKAKEIDKHTNGEVVSMKHKKTDEHANSIEDKIVSYFNILITIAIGFFFKKNLIDFAQNAMSCSIFKVNILLFNNSH